MIKPIAAMSGISVQCIPSTIFAWHGNIAAIKVYLHALQITDVYSYSKCWIFGQLVGHVRICTETFFLFQFMM